MIPTEVYSHQIGRPVSPITVSRCGKHYGNYFGSFSQICFRCCRLFNCPFSEGRRCAAFKIKLKTRRIIKLVTERGTFYLCLSAFYRLNQCLAFSLAPHFGHPFQPPFKFCSQIYFTERGWIFMCVVFTQAWCFQFFVQRSFVHSVACFFITCTYMHVLCTYINPAGISVDVNSITY